MKIILIKHTIQNKSLSAIRRKGVVFFMNGLFYVSLFFLLAGCVPEMTVVELRSTPEGANVSEGASGLIGQTPTNEMVEVGTCKADRKFCIKSYVFSLPAYETTRVERVISGNRVVVHALLKRLKTTLRVKVVPNFAKVQLISNKGMLVNYLGSASAGISLDDDSLWDEDGKGLFRIKLTAPGYEDVTESVRLIRGKKQVKAFVLKEKFAIVQFHSTPDGVDVYDRSLGYLGRTPFSVELSASKLVRISTRPSQALREKNQLQLTTSKKGYKTSEMVKDIYFDGNKNNVINFVLHLKH